MAARLVDAACLRRGRAALLGTLLLAASIAVAPASRGNERDAPPKTIDWPADFAALLSGLARNYANFEYTLTERRIDLPAIAARYRAALAAAKSDDDRRNTFESLLRDFRDPHLSIDWQPHTGGGTPGPICQANATQYMHPGIAFRRLPEFTALETDEARVFQAGMLRLKGVPPTGVLRIGLFIERMFAPACRAAAAALGKQPEDPCDGACSAEADRHAASWLNRALVATVQALQRAGAQRLLIDVTNNGGGSDWAEIVARMLGGPLRSAQVAMLKHPAWEAWLEGRLREIEGKLPAATAADRKRLDRAVTLLRAARAMVATPCDLSAAWNDSELATGRRDLPCTTLVKTQFFASGVEATALRPGAPNEIDRLLFHPAGYGAFPVGVTRLPLLVLVNRDTHSAAEQFAAILRDNGSAALLGEASAGAACGTFTGTGTAFTLPGSGARVNVPDCVRLRRDGSNERRGIVPDRLIAWAPSDSAWQRARKVADALRTR